MKRSAWITILLVFTLCAGAFVYTFVQPRWTASITSVGWPKSVQSRSRRGRSYSYTVVPLTVTFTDAAGSTQTVSVNYPRPAEPLTVGQQVVITRKFGGYTIYPFTGLRLFSGTVAGALGLFLAMMRLDGGKKKQPPS
ncbi:MAG: hypothetical protein IKP40_02370 [Clostridia bacterium]|nr:hypothetical protein [Clostridia bacterium]